MTKTTSSFKKENMKGQVRDFTNSEVLTRKIACLINADRGNQKKGIAALVKRVNTSRGVYISEKTPMIMIIGVKSLKEVNLPKGWHISENVNSSISDDVKIQMLMRGIGERLYRGIPITTQSSVEYLPEFSADNLY